MTINNPQVKRRDLLKAGVAASAVQAAVFRSALKTAVWLPLRATPMHLLTEV